MSTSTSTLTPTRSSGSNANASAPPEQHVDAAIPPLRTAVGVRWTQDGFQGVTTSRHTFFKGLEEAEAYCAKVNARYPEITQWPVSVEFDKAGRVLRVIDEA